MPRPRAAQRRWRLPSLMTTGQLIACPAAGPIRPSRPCWRLPVPGAAALVPSGAWRGRHWLPAGHPGWPGRHIRPRPRPPPQAEAADGRLRERIPTGAEPEGNAPRRARHRVGLHVTADCFCRESIDPVQGSITRPGISQVPGWHGRREGVCWLGRSRLPVPVAAGHSPLVACNVGTDHGAGPWGWHG